MKIFGVKSKITKCIDDEGWPSFVECEFTDARGITHQFRDKDVMFSSKTLDKESNYPVMRELSTVRLSTEKMMEVVFW